MAAKRKPAKPIDLESLEFRKQSERFLPVIEALRSASRSASVKLNCLDCTCYNIEEIRNCDISSCAMWPVRPFQEIPDQQPERDKAISEFFEQLKTEP